MLTPIVPNVVDFAGLEQLRRDAARDKPEAVAEAAVQFEALFIGILLQSAREASLGEGIFDGEGTREYLDLMDRQVALDIARRGGFGLGGSIAEQLRRPDATVPDDGGAGDAVSVPGDAALRRDRAEPGVPGRARTPEAFVESVFAAAQAAARRLGVDPRVLVAQAALETGWGKFVPAHADGRPGFNLFGIKAGPGWRGERIAQTTLESVDGTLRRQREQFRAYSSVEESFDDYARLIEQTPRYARALEAPDAETYVNEVAGAGYATDPGYARKWLDVYAGEQLTSALAMLKETSAEPTN